MCKHLLKTYHVPGTGYILVNERQGFGPDGAYNLAEETGMNKGSKQIYCDRA